MNERIEKLAEQAGLYHMLDNGHLYPTSFTAEQSITAYNTFAELIVKECARQVNCYEALNIFEHFGVKE